MDDEEIYGFVDNNPVAFVHGMSVTEEYGQLYSGGEVLVWDAESFSHRSVQARIKAGQRFGGKVLRRKVIVLQDWQQVDALGMD